MQRFNAFVPPKMHSTLDAAAEDESVRDLSEAVQIRTHTDHASTAHLRSGEIRPHPRCVCLQTNTSPFILGDVEFTRLIKYIGYVQ